MFAQALFPAINPPVKSQAGYTFHVVTEAHEPTKTRSSDPGDENRAPNLPIDSTLTPWPSMPPRHRTLESRAPEAPGTASHPGGSKDRVAMHRCDQPLRNSEFADSEGFPGVSQPPSI